MRYFSLLLWLRIKATIHSVGFTVTAIFILGLSATLAVILPQGTGSGLKVGVIAQGTLSENIAQQFSQNKDYEIVLYSDRTEMEQDVMSGQLHCGYLLEDQAEFPVTVLETEGSYMRFLLDELVLSARYEVLAPQMAEEYLMEHGHDPSNAQEDYLRLSRSEPPLRIQLETTGRASVEDLTEGSLQPLLYAVLISVFVASAILSVLLKGEEEVQIIAQLRSFGKHPLATFTAPLFAGILLNIIVLLAADLLISHFSGMELYSFEARLGMFILLAAFTALVSPLAARLRRCSTVSVILLPPVLLLWILCSGGIVSPERLPVGLGLLRFLSPAWYALQLLHVL